MYGIDLKIMFDFDLSINSIVEIVVMLFVKDARKNVSFYRI
jgi:hypothetical protein